MGAVVWLRLFQLLDILTGPVLLVFRGSAHSTGEMKLASSLSFDPSEREAE